MVPKQPQSTFILMQRIRCSPDGIELVTPSLDPLQKPSQRSGVRGDAVSSWSGSRERERRVLYVEPLGHHHSCYRYY